MKTKICTKCGEGKSVSAFTKHKQKKDGLFSWCKGCKNKYDVIYHRKNPWKITLNYIKMRCNNTNNHKYPNYGGRGIQCILTEEDVKRLWFRDKAWLLEWPSIDRKDNNGNYCFDNCRFIEMGENSNKDKKKIVLQFDVDGNFIREWSSAKEPSKQLKIHRSCISACCRYERKKAGGFVWKYKN